MTYRISNVCEPKNVQFLISEPSGEFNDFAMCEIKRIFPSWNPNEPMETITVEEAESRLEEARIAEPDKYHHRAIHAVDSAGDNVTLSCYFNKEWVITSYALGIGDTVKLVNSDYVESLPVQRYESKFETRP